MCLLSAAFVLTVIIFSDVLNFVDIELWLVKPPIAAVELFIKLFIRLQLHSVVSDSSFTDVMFLAAVLCYCG